MKNFAVIGLGFIWPRHRLAIEELGGKILMTCDSDPAKGATFTDWVEMYNHTDFEKIDAIIICTPNYLHAVQAREALLRGKKVLCEKPLSIDDTRGLQGVKTVLQLRHHPELKGIKAQRAYIEAKMYRDETYWNSWKGQEVKSGGILYNLGVHYIDLLIYLLGRPKKILEVATGITCASGMIKFERGEGKYLIQAVDSREKQGRRIIVNGKEINLSDKDNLSYEDLHKEVYKDFMKGKGVGVSEAKKSLDLIKQLCK